MSIYVCSVRGLRSQKDVFYGGPEGQNTTTFQKNMTFHKIHELNVVLSEMLCFWPSGPPYFFLTFFLLSSMKCTSGPEDAHDVEDCAPHIGMFVSQMFGSACFLLLQFFFFHFPLYSYLYPSDSPCLRGREVHCCCLFAQEENARIQRSSVSEGAAVKPRG